jgi:ABC-type multidrug transport system fused ATPase/permease subunit
LASPLILSLYECHHGKCAVLSRPSSRNHPLLHACCKHSRALALAAIARDSYNPYIELKNVSIAFGSVQVLGGVSFGVMSQQSVCIMGRSGAGSPSALGSSWDSLSPTPAA